MLNQTNLLVNHLITKSVFLYLCKRPNEIFINKNYKKTVVDT
jgi:hypothetical protein